MSEKKTLTSKLVEVMRQVKYIKKTGYNEFNRYKYATEAEVSEKVREVLAEQNVILIPSMKSHSVREHTNRKGHIEYIVTVEVEFTFIDGDTGESISFTVFGEGQDPGDKATYKAFTGAQKYALMKAFIIPTEDDPEADNGVDERNSDQAEQDTPPATLKAKYQAGKGSLDGFDEWVKDMQAKGFSYKAMEEVLAKRLIKKTKPKEEKANAQ